MAEIMIEKRANHVILIALILLIMVKATALDVNIDYSHNVAGTGTIMTDFEMGSFEGTRAIGEVHGTGEVMNRYAFFSNNSKNVTILDQFLFTKAQTFNDTTLESYPKMERKPGSFRLLGTVWSERIDSLEPKIY